MSTRSAQDVAAQLRDVYESFERDAGLAVSHLEDLYDVGLVFRDPLQTIRGREGFLAMNRRILGRARRLGFAVHDAVGAEDSLFLAWTMTYEPHRGPALVFEGSTHAHVRGGLVVEQRDYWDLLSTVAQSLPVVRRIYAALAPHLG